MTAYWRLIRPPPPQLSSFTELLVLNNNSWKDISVYKQMINSKYNYSYKIEISETSWLCAKNMSTGSFKHVISKMYLENIFDIYV